MEKLKTHKEVIDKIIEGYEKSKSTYDQSEFYHADSADEKHPCGTSFCLMGSLITSLFLDNPDDRFFLLLNSGHRFSFWVTLNHRDSFDLIESYEVAEFWAKVFYQHVAEEAIEMLLDMESWDSYPEFKESLEKLLSVIDPNCKYRASIAPDKLYQSQDESL